MNEAGILDTMEGSQSGSTMVGFYARILLVAVFVFEVSSHGSSPSPAPSGPDLRAGSGT